MSTSGIRLASLLMAISVGGLACAATPPQSSANQQVSMTRPMLVFYQLEQDLAAAIAKHDQATTDRLLSGDFEFRPDTHAGEPTARTDWLADDAAGSSGNIEQLGVRDFGVVAIVSFVMTATQGAGPAPRSYVVDAWKKQGDNWQLITRYQSSLPAVSPRDEDIAPTGKG